MIAHGTVQIAGRPRHTVSISEYLWLGIMEPTVRKHVNQAVDNWTTNYDRMAAAIDYVVAHRETQPSLERIAKAVNLSPFHFQRLFSHWTGLSPKRFLAVLTMDTARKALLSGESVLKSALEAGLSGPSRLYDLAVTLEAATPGEIAGGGKGLTINAGIAATPFGEAVFVDGRRGLSAIAFLDETDQDPEAFARQSWPHANIVADDTHASALSARIFLNADPDRPLKLWVKGTNWQVQVWRALLKVPFGGLASYKTLAEKVGATGAYRAVGNAVGSNPVAPIIPCHRVIRETGALGGYRWGSTRKRALLAAELSGIAING